MGPRIGRALPVVAAFVAACWLTTASAQAGIPHGPVVRAVTGSYERVLDEGLFSLSSEAPSPAPMSASTALLRALQAASATPARQVPQADPKHLSGTGKTATEQIALSLGIWVATFAHDGSNDFVVTMVGPGDIRDLMVQRIGPYRGQRPLAGGKTITFDVDADGPWSIVLTPVTTTADPAFSGAEDSVSPLFDPPSNGPWLLTYTGEQKFCVKLHCAGGCTVLHDEAGPTDGSADVTFAKGPCLWEVHADGAWSLAPK